MDDAYYNHILNQRHSEHRADPFFICASYPEQRPDLISNTPNVENSRVEWACPVLPRAKTDSAREEQLIKKTERIQQPQTP